MTRPAVTVTDEQRIDLDIVRAWYARAGSYMTVVLATCQEEARALGAYWIGKARGRPIVDGHRMTVREATGEDVKRWLELRRQDQAGTKGAAQ